MRTILKPGSVELNTVSEFDTFVNADDNCVIGELSISVLILFFCLFNHMTTRYIARAFTCSNNIASMKKIVFS